jgi:hypothetical protein
MAHLAIPPEELRGRDLAHDALARFGEVPRDVPFAAQIDLAPYPLLLP